MSELRTISVGSLENRQSFPLSCFGFCTWKHYKPARNKQPTSLTDEKKMIDEVQTLGGAGLTQGCNHAGKRQRTRKLMTQLICYYQHSFTLFPLISDSAHIPHRFLFSVIWVFRTGT